MAENSNKNEETESVKEEKSINFGEALKTEPMEKQSKLERYWTKKSLALDWTGPDRADSSVLNRVIWHTLHGVNTPYPIVTH